MAFQATNDLEHSLVKAATDPAHRPQFYQDFLISDVIAITHSPPAPHEPSQPVQTGEKINLRVWEQDGKSVIPIFSSLPRLQAFLTEEADYVSVPARTFLEMTKGATLILNPGADYGKEFTPEEVSSLLDGSIYRPSESYVASAGTEIIMGQPANYPTELASALIRCFETMPQVKRAYLAHIFNPKQDQQPHTLIALEITGDWNQVISKAGIVVTTVHVPAPPVDFLQLKGTDEFENHIRQNFKPFYESNSQLQPPESIANQPQGQATKKPWWRFW